MARVQRIGQIKRSAIRKALQGSFSVGIVEMLKTQRPQSEQTQSYGGAWRWMLTLACLRRAGISENADANEICRMAIELGIHGNGGGQSIHQKLFDIGEMKSFTDDAIVADPKTLVEVASNGEQMGEVMIRSNTVMKGYLKNKNATLEAFEGGWFHTGDLAVRHGDGYIEIKDRSKDVIISGGENISSLEIEELLHRHPSVMEAAVVARPDGKWGETPCAFVTTKPDARDVSEADLIGFCRENMAHFKVPKHVIFGDIPKTVTGKVQNVSLRKLAKNLVRNG